MKISVKAGIAILVMLFAAMLTGCGGDSFAVSLQNGTASEIQREGEELISFVVKDAKGNDVRFLCENAVVNAEDQIILHEGGHLFTTTPLPGLKKLNIKNVTGADEDAWVEWSGGYGSNEAVITEFSDIVWGNSNATGAMYKDANHKLRCEPSYFQLTSWKGDVIINSFTLTYDSSKPEIGFEKVYLDENFYGAYAEGTRYDPLREQFDADNGILDFYLVMIPENHNKKSDEGNWVYGTRNYTVGSLYDQAGNAKEKEAPLTPGDQLGVYLCGREYKVDLPVYPKRSEANLHAEMPYATAPGTGELKVLVVPFYFKDQTEFASEQQREEIKKALGRVLDEKGNETVYTLDSGAPTLSEYYETASYGKLRLASFVTDWFAVPKGSYEDLKFEALDVKYVDMIQAWVQKQYGSLDNALDQDGNGYYDAVILVCSGNGTSEFVPGTLSGAVKSSFAYGTERLTKDGKKAIGSAVVASGNVLHEFGEDTLGAETIIHEFGHMFGLIDYYDPTYGEINVVGNYDMMSGSIGDHNPYSKFAIGWTDPMVLTPEEIEEKGTVEVTLESFAVTGDTLLIPVKGTKVVDGKISPFEEYIAVDYFTADGVNRSYAGRGGLEDMKGVMIYHVNGTSVERSLTDEAHKTAYSLISEAFYSVKNNAGMYQVEVIQKPGVNTFTDVDNLMPILSYDDFFFAGDSFSLKTHGAFFYNGKMDNGTEFPYEITVKSLTDQKAVIEVKYVK